MKDATPEEMLALAHLGQRLTEEGEPVARAMITVFDRAGVMLSQATTDELGGVPRYWSHVKNPTSGVDAESQISI